MNSDRTGAGHGLVGAMDMTGNPDDRQNTHMAIIIGRKEYLQSVADAMGSKRVHMRRMSRKDRRDVLNRLKLNTKDCIAVCVKIDKDATVEAVSNMRRMRKTHASRKRVLRSYHRLLLGQICGMLENFLAKHNVRLSEIPFQCDSDCVGFAKDTGLLYEVVGDGDSVGDRIHGVADAIVWENNHGKEPKNVVQKDVAKKTRRILTDDLAGNLR